MQLNAKCFDLQDWRLYYAMPTYEDMLYRYWWIWDVYDFPMNLPRIEKTTCKSTKKYDTK